VVAVYLPKHSPEILTGHAAAAVVKRVEGVHDN
jgi:hypothetical protein